MSGLLDGIRVVELASERAAFTGKLLADFGASVTLVEPPGGHRTRTYEPFLDDEPGPDRSLWFWHYNSSKRSVIADLNAPGGVASLHALIAEADVVLEAEDPGVLRALGIDGDVLRAVNPRIVWASVTPFGSAGPRSNEPATDLTLSASGGIAWNCGYDDHSLPPMRGQGNQAWHTGAMYALNGILTALVSRDVTGVGQFVDVNINAAVNITTEAGSYEWLVAGQTVQRMTCRHAGTVLTTPALATAADGRLVHTGFPPRFKRDFEGLLAWLHKHNLADRYDETFFLEMAVERNGVKLPELATDPEQMAMYGAGREAIRFIAGHLRAYDFFVEGQQHGLPVGVVNAPEDVMNDPHWIERGFVVDVEHLELGRSFRYPGLPFRGTAAGGEVRRAPLLPSSR